MVIIRKLMERIFARKELYALDDPVPSVRELLKVKRRRRAPKAPLDSWTLEEKPEENHSTRVPVPDSPRMQRKLHFFIDGETPSDGQLDGSAEQSQELLDKIGPSSAS